MRKFVTIKCQDVLQLNTKIEELKIEEEEELNVLNKVYAENDQRHKKLLKKNDKKDLLIMRWVDMWRQKKQKKNLYAFWKKYAKRKGDIKRNSEFCDTFFDQGLKMRALKGIKLYC